jgi:hypothetical protein
MAIWKLVSLWKFLYWKLCILIIYFVKEPFFSYFCSTADYTVGIHKDLLSLYFSLSPSLSLFPQFLLLLSLECLEFVSQRTVESIVSSQQQFSSTLTWITACVDPAVIMTHSLRKYIAGSRENFSLTRIHSNSRAPPRRALSDTPQTPCLFILQCAAPFCAEGADRMMMSEVLGLLSLKK